MPRLPPPIPATVLTLLLLATACASPSAGPTTPGAPLADTAVSADTASADTASADTASPDTASDTTAPPAKGSIQLLLINAATDKDGKKYRDHRTITGFDKDRGPQFAPRLDISWDTP